MKKLSLILSSTAFAVAAVGPFGLFLLLLLINFSVSPVALATAQNAINTTTAAALASGNANVREQLWAINMIFGSDPIYDDTPFADRMTGRINAAERPDPKKLKMCVIEVADTTKVFGNTINIPTVGGIGGEGVTGENTRRGTEAAMYTGNFTVKIGKQFFSVGITQVAIDETLLGRNATWSKTINIGLRTQHNRKKSNSIIMSMRVVADANNANKLFPSGITTRDGLLSTSVVNTPLITKAGDYLPSLGAVPMNYVADDAGSLQETFVWFGVDKALNGLKTEPALLQARNFAANRGPDNRVFKGGFESWDGHDIYRWLVRDHANPTSIGNPLLARARLGTALVAADTGSFITGGGALRAVYEPLVAAAAIPNWFEFFSNAPWTFYGGFQTIVADVATTRYLVIINADGSGYSYYSYQVNDGNKITILNRWTNGGALTNTSNTHGVGSVIAEVNAKGVPFARSLMLGAQAVAAGVGRVGGTPSDPQMAKRIEQVDDYENARGIGAEAAWGCAAVQRAGDNAYPGFVLIEHAVFVSDLLPVVTV